MGRECVVREYFFIEKRRNQLIMIFFYIVLPPWGMENQSGEVEIGRRARQLLWAR